MILDPLAPADKKATHGGQTTGNPTPRNLFVGQPECQMMLLQSINIACFEHAWRCLIRVDELIKMTSVGDH